MDFNEFKEEILNFLNDQSKKLELGEFVTHQVTKNNGVILTGISLLDETKRVSPTLYLEHFYELYEEGMMLDDVVSEIVKVYRRAVDSKETYRIEDELNLGLENIIIKLVNYDKNVGLLDRIPYIKYMDLLITFRYYIDSFDNSIGTALVTNENICDSSISTEELYEIALSNTRKYLPENLFSLNDFFEENITDEQNQELENLGVKVLTNSKFIDGATMILYEDLLRDFSDSINDSFYIIPSSIHEVMLVPRTSVPNSDYIEDMISFVNKNELIPEEYLSDSLYYYDRDLAQVRIH